MYHLAHWTQMCAAASDAGFFDQCVRMADEATPEDWQVVKMRIWARQWRASKLAPKKYGDKVEQTLVGDPERPVAVDATLSPSDAYLRMIGK